MTCPDPRLDEYLDGELAGDAAAAVERHLDSCPACRTELEHSRKLEGVLRSVSVGAAPDADRFVQSVKARARRPLFGPRAFAAAALIAVAGISMLLYPGTRVDVRADLARYAGNPSAEIEGRIRSAGPAALAELEAALLQESDGRMQFAAAALLFKLADGATRDRVLARYQQRKEPAGAWTLSEPGTDDDDSELIPVTVSLAIEGRDSRALAVLQKLNRLNLQAQRKTVESVVTLLHSTNVDIQRHALEIVKKLEVEFPLTAVVDLLDSPELGEEAHRFLVQETKQDCGKDKSAWLKAVGGNP